MGYPARSVFKLEEIDRRLALLRSGQVVLDLGAAPGSWSRYAARRVQPGGVVVAVDLVPLVAPVAPNVTVITADALADPNEVASRAPFDVVLSDMAPATTGSRVSDQARSLELFERALSLASRFGGPGSSFVGKLFMGGAFEQARCDVARSYRVCRVIRPAGTRSNSFEIFLAGLQRR